jgi:uncharacterized protein
MSCNRDVLEIVDIHAGDRQLTDKDRELLLDAVYENLKSIELMPPSNLEVLVCEDCNLRCDYCFEPTKNPKTMTAEIGMQTVDFLLRECGDKKNLGILFFGGEPLLAFPTIRAIVEYANKAATNNDRQISYSMTTNGTLLNEEILEFCGASKIGTLISIDGLPEVHDAHRKTCCDKGSYALIEKNLPLIFKYLGRPQIRVTPFPDTASRLVEGIKHLLGLGFNNFIIGAAHGIEWPDEEYQVFHHAMEEVIEMAFADRSGTPLFHIQTISDTPVQCGWGCRAGKGYISVGADGRLGTCSLVMGSPGIGDQYILGNVKNGFTQEILRQEFCLIQSHRIQKCIDCELSKWCCGGCPGNNYKATGSILHPSSHTCREIKYQLEHQKLWHYYEQKYGGMRVWQLSGA